jgi:hypothetical protein
MKRILRLRLARYVLLSLAIVSAAGTGLGLYTSAVRRDRDADGKRNFHERLRDGVGREVKFASPGDSADNVRVAVESLAHFIHARSGVQLGEQTKAWLADLEGRTISGEYHPLTVDELSDAIGRTAIERIATLSDEQINYAAECLRGFDAPDLPDSFRHGRNKIRLRASKAGGLTPEQFIAQAKALRGADEASRSIFLGATKSAVSAEIKGRKTYLGEALPEQFGPADSGMTPLQALLITYSVASDDLLTDSEAGLHDRMRSIQEGITRQKGVPFPSPEGHSAYGPNGYVFSTPLDLVLDDQTLGLLLDHLAGRGTSR